jgi:O-antigen ligase
MTIDVQTGVLAGVATALFVVGLLRPWPAAVALLATLPFNGLLVNFGARALDVSGEARLALAAWHDGLALGIIAAAVVALARQRRWRPTSIELLAGLVLLVGLVYVVVAPHLLTAMYAYRTLYEPVLVFLALLTLARTNGAPSWLGRRVAVAIICPAIVASLFTWWQVYVGGFMYLDRYYHDAGDVLSVSYTATFINQPRGIGTFNSPNEFGAYLSMCVGLLVAPGLIQLRPWVRAWALAVIVLALLLSFSRSGWLSTLVIVTVIAFLVRDQLPGFLRRLREPGLVRQLAPPLITSVALVAVILSSSGAPRYVGSTVMGDEPSAGARGESAAQGMRIVGIHPWGLGLGTAGPKSTRFEETGVGVNPAIHSETWYLDYAIQTGAPGALALAAFLLAIGRCLWSNRARRWSRFAFAIALGPAVGAIFIPIIDDPAVAMPLWSILAIGVIAGRAGGDHLGAGTATEPDELTGS